jgi:hypothetical protein
MQVYQATRDDGSTAALKIVEGQDALAQQGVEKEVTVCLAVSGCDASRYTSNYCCLVPIIEQIQRLFLSDAELGMRLTSPLVLQESKCCHPL